MPEISLGALALCLAPTLGVFAIGQRWTREGSEILTASLRMIVQLLLVGYALVLIFESPSPWVGGGVVGVMVLVSAWIGVRKVRAAKGLAFRRAVFALGTAGVLTLLFVVFAVLRLEDPRYQPRILIPLAGMILSNAMTAVTLAAERFERERSGGLDFPAARSAAWMAALIPQINGLLAVGLVSLPGMMTGQILSGVDPLVAVRYQIVVMAMLLQASGFAVALFLWLAGRDVPAVEAQARVEERV